MSFTSLFFLFGFLPAGLVLYYMVPARFRKIPLILISLVFFAWSRPEHLIFLVLSLALNCVGLKQIGLYRRSGHPRLAKAALLVTLGADLGTLVVLKYLPFLISNLNRIPGLSLSPPELAAPVGLMFYIPTALSCLLDVYCGRAEAPGSILDAVAYMTFFPKLLSGPIVQYRDMAPQLAEPRRFARENLCEGVLLLSVGLFKKVLVADNLALLFQAVGGLETMSVGTAWLGMLLYTLELYFDFSGYSDMAIGISRMLGYEIGANFRYPYRALDINDFWRRWHISLGAWFREYIYFPLGGSRGGTLKTLRNLLVVWLLTGLWHGASWNFVFWGLWHCAFCLLWRFGVRDRMDRWSRPIRAGITFLIVALGWVPFFSPDLSAALRYFGQLLGLGGLGLWDDTFLYYLRSSLLLLILALIGSGPGAKALHSRLLKRPGPLPAAISTLGGLILLLLSIACMVSDTFRTFLYFQF